MDDVLRRRAFFRGFLYALCTKLKGEFLVEGDAYHQAFGATVDYARKLAAEGKAPHPIRLHIDPLFGVYREANEMILEGQQDLLLSLINPTLRKATFRINPEEAQRRLENISEKEWYRDLADYFVRQLPATR